MVVLVAALALPASARADVVELDPATDTVRVAGRLDGALTGPAAGAAAPIGLKYVREHRRALGLSAADLETLADPTVTADGGIRQVRWRQEVDGIPVADAELRVNVDAGGRVINVLGSPATDLPSDTTPLLGKPDPSAALTIFEGRLGYRYTDEVAPTEIYDTISDADTGKVLKRTNLVKSSTALVWDNHPRLDVAATRVDLTPWLSTTLRLEGTWVHAYADVNGTNTVTNITQNAQSTFEYPFVSTFSPAGVGCTSAKPCSWNGANDTVATNRNQSTVQAFYLANRFRDHLAAAPIGFDGFSGVDKIKLETGNGTSRNNANMFTPPEGQSPRMQMYLWSGSGYRSVNSADDASILFHEYTHGLTGRLVVDADGVQALGSWQSGAMGEGWSDFYAKDYLVSEGHETDGPGAGDIDMGAYVDSTPHSMRSAALDCPVNACSGRGYTYGDFAKIAGGPEFHADGEIWAQTLWDLRTALTTAPGVTLAIVTQALRLSPPEPSFLDMRNAILQADTALFAGVHHATIWSVFAARGMGFFASTVDGADTAPLEDFEPPPVGATETLTGQVTDAGVPVAGATVTLGPRVVQTLADGTFAIDALPAATYAHLSVTAPGFDRLVLDDIDVPGTADAALRRNWASVRGGATVTSTVGAENAPIGCGPKQAVDGLASSTWSTQQGADKPLVVKLPGLTDITGLAIDPTAGCGDLGGSSTAQYTVEVGTSPTGPWTQIAGGTFNATHRNKLNAVAATASGAEYVRITPMTTQTLNASYIDLSEFAVYGTPSFEARILTGPTGPTGPVQSATFTFAGFGTTSFECRIDAAPFAPCSSGDTFSPPDGAHTFELRGVKGGLYTPVVSRSFTINTQLPETTLTAAPPALTNATTVSFSFSGGTSYRCAIDGSEFSACTSGQSWAVGEGPHTFVVRAVNNVGEDATPAVHSFTVDTTPPDTVITWAPPPILTAREFAFAFAASEAATFTCSVDGLPAVACSSPFTVTGFGEGAHNVVVTATDAAGNVDPTPARSDFTVALPSLGPSPSPTPTATATPTVTPKRKALTSATVPKTASRKGGKVKVTLRGVRGSKVAVQAKLGSRVVGRASKTLRGSSLSFQLTLDKRRLRPGATVTVRVQATGSGLTSVTRTLKFRLKA